ncbi:MAG: MerR family transcriptional regulator, partial [Gammaproteobacteria bacterium]
MAKQYRITAFSELTSVTVRTLHYYDEIGLLKPTSKTASGHRLYSEYDLLRLQQITTLKFMGFSLAAIKKLLQPAEFNVNAALKLQADVLTTQAQRIEQAAALLRYTAGQLAENQAVNWYSIAKIIEILEMNNMSNTSFKQAYSTVEAS